MKIFSDQNLTYLHTPARRIGLFLLLSCGYLFNNFINSKPIPLLLPTAGLVILAVIAASLRRARWVVYLLLCMAIMVHTYAFVHLDANGDQDQLSTRDAAVELTAQALGRGENAWNVELGVGITTGPASILLALPFVLIFGEINWLSFLFWLLLTLVLLWCDIQRENDTWLNLGMFFLLGWFDFHHTMHWSLEELYYPLLYLVLAYYLVMNRNWLGVGATFAAAILSRPNYAFLVIGFLSWHFFLIRFTRREAAKMALGFVIAGILIMLPFLIVGGNDLLANNPWQHAVDMSGATLPGSNPILRTINQLTNLIGIRAMPWVKLSGALLLILAFAWFIKVYHPTHHPFWHIAASAFIAHTVMWLPSQLPRDYTLLVYLPLFLGIAMTRIQKIHKAESPIEYRQL